MTPLEDKKKALKKKDEDETNGSQDVLQPGMGGLGKGAVVMTGINDMQEND